MNRHAAREPQAARRDRSATGRTRRQPARAFILVCVLVCVGVASAIMLGAMTASLRARRQVNREGQMEQTRWLAEAAFARGLRKLRSQTDYQGERWDAGDAFPAFAVAEASIEVLPAETDGAPRRLSVTARLGRSDSQVPLTQRSLQRAVTAPEIDEGQP